MRYRSQGDGPFIGAARRRLSVSLCLLCVFAASLRSAEAQQLSLPPVTRATLDNGIRLVLMEYHRTPTLNVSAVFPGGDAGDPADRAGVAGMVASLIRRGTEKRTATQIAEDIDFLGGSLGAGAENDAFTVSLSVLAKDTDAGLDLFADVIRHATFPEAEVERVRQLELSDLEALPEDPGSIASRVTTETVFAGHPYGAVPTITSMKAIARDDLLAYYHRFLIPNRMILVAVGDFHTSEMQAKLRARFGDWPKGDEAALNVPSVAPTKPKFVLVDKPDATQTQVRFAEVGFPRSSPDYFPARVANGILGGGFTSRLVDEVRINRSLTYGIGSGFRAWLRGGEFTVSTFTKIETTRALLDTTRAVLKRTAEQGFTSGEMQKIKGYLSGQFAIGMQTPDALAAQLADITFYGLPDNYLQTYLGRLRAVTLADANRIAHAYFPPDRLSLVLVAPAAKVSGQLKGLGNAETRSVETVGK
jgi:zinc protease